MSNVNPWTPITYSCKDTELTRKEIAAHNTVYESLKTGKLTEVKDTCPTPKKPAPKA